MPQIRMLIHSPFVANDSELVRCQKLVSCIEKHGNDAQKFQRSVRSMLQMILR